MSCLKRKVRFIRASSEKEKTDAQAMSRQQSQVPPPLVDAPLASHGSRGGAVRTARQREGRGGARAQLEAPRRHPACRTPSRGFPGTPSYATRPAAAASAAGV